MSLKLNPSSAELIQKFLSSKEAPVKWFDYITSGAFKECYSLDSDYVIKFNSPESETDKELYIQDLIQEEEFDYVFLPLYFFSLKNPLPSTYLNFEEDPMTWNSKLQTYVEKDEEELTKDELISYYIQEKISIFGENHPKGTDPKDYPFLSWDEVMALPNNELWIERFIIEYGKDELRRLANFLIDNHIYDLHNCNIGFKEKDIPVIIDWLS